MTFQHQPFPGPLSSNNSQAEPALAVETERLRQLLRQQRPEEVAQLGGAAFVGREGGGGELSLELWGAPVVLGFPELVARRADGSALALPVQALLMFYLATGDGISPAGEWVSFADLPSGRIYAQAFQGYSGSLLARTFGEDIQAFRQACLAAGGIPAALGDAGFTFAALPRLPLAVIYWQGEEDLPSTSKILFDPTATHYLPIDVCAILGSMLVSRILKANSAKG